MDPQLTYWIAEIRYQWQRLRAATDRGVVTTEAVIITAVLAAAAVIVIGILGDKIADKARSIPLN